MTRPLALGVLAGVLLLATPAARAEEGSYASTYTPTYAAWQDPAKAGSMAELLTNLRALIDKAERDKAAEPVFLGDLRALADKYDAGTGWPAKLVYDDFHDGDYTTDPAWTVVSGEWYVDDVGGEETLYSQVGQQASSKGSEILLSVLGKLLSQQNGQTATQQTEPQNQAATILLPATIPDQFSLKLALVSMGGSGQFNFGPISGHRGDNSYQLSYVPGAANGFVLSRIVNRQRTVLASTGAVKLEGGKSHIVQWNRGPGGKMTVILDGKTVISVTDAGSRKAFTGFVMVNTGGSYGIRSIAINGVKQ
jgi:hypothetical protein